MFVICEQCNYKLLQCHLKQFLWLNFKLNFNSRDVSDLYHVSISHDYRFTRISKNIRIFQIFEFQNFNFHIIIIKCKENENYSEPIKITGHMGRGRCHAVYMHHKRLVHAIKSLFMQSSQSSLELSMCESDNDSCFQPHLVVYGITIKG